MAGRLGPSRCLVVRPRRTGVRPRRGDADRDRGGALVDAPARRAGRRIFYVLAGDGVSLQWDGDEASAYEISAGDCLVHRANAEAHTLRAGEEGLDVIAFGERPLGGSAYLPRAGSPGSGTRGSSRAIPRTARGSARSRRASPRCRSSRRGPGVSSTCETPSLSCGTTRPSARCGATRHEPPARFAPACGTSRSSPTRTWRHRMRIRPRTRCSSCSRARARWSCGRAHDTA